MSSSSVRPSRGRSDRGRVSYPRHDVVAVLVAHDGQRWLPQTLSALKRQHRPPQLTIAVDTGSTDATGSLLTEAFAPDVIVTVARDTGFGAAVAAGLASAAGAASRRDGAPYVERQESRRRTPAAAGSAEAVPSGRIGWVWLLHDDSAPDPDALEQLLALAEDMPSVSMLGVKARDWDDPRLLVEVGVTTDAAGHRSTGLERREYDQGQHDAVRDVLAVGTAGALIRRDVWDLLGGLDPALPLFRDDIDLGWRAAQAGHRVVVAPQASIRHARAAATGKRRLDAVAGSPAGVDRRHALYAVMANVSGLALVTAVPRLTVGALLRALAFLLTRRPGAAGDELAALGFVLGHPRRLVGARCRRRAVRTVSARSLRPLLAGRGARLRGYVEALGDIATGSDRPAPSGSVVGAGAAIGETGPSTADDDLVPVTSQRLRRLLVRPGFLLVVGLTLLVLLAGRRLVGSGALYGGALLPAPGGARDLWSVYLSSWHGVGPGTAASAPPYLALLAAVATLLLGKAWLAVNLLLTGSVPLAGLSAFLASRRVVRALPLRLWAALTYALLPVATGALAAGRLGDSIAFVLLPPLVVYGARLLTSDSRTVGWRHVWATGLLLSIALACSPALYPMAAVLLLAGAVLLLLVTSPASRPAAVRRAVGAVLAALLPLVLLMPWSLSVLRHPGVLAYGTGRPLPGLVDPRLHSAALLLLWPGGPGLPVVLTATGLLLAALVGLGRSRRRVLARSAWALAITGVVAGVVISRVSAVPPAGRPAVAGWPGTATAVAAIGLLVTALVGAEGARQRLGARSFGWRQPAAGLVVVLAAAMPVVAGVHFLLRGADRPVHLGRPSPLPAFAVAGLGGGGRALFLRTAPDGSIGYDLTRAEGNRLGDADLRVPPAERTHLDGVVRQAVVAQGGDAAAALSSYDVRYVVTPAEGSTALAAVLDAQAGLVKQPFAGSVRLWKVAVPTARLVVLPPALASASAATGAPTASQLVQTPPEPVGARARIPAGPADRELVLAEAADPGWRASLDGRPLPRRTAWGWAQGFALPSSGGVVTVRHVSPTRSIALWLQLGLLLLVVVLAAPSPRRAREEIPPPVADTSADRGSSPGGSP